MGILSFWEYPTEIAGKNERIFHLSRFNPSKERIFWNSKFRELAKAKATASSEELKHMGSNGKNFWLRIQNIEIKIILIKIFFSYCGFFTLDSVNSGKLSISDSGISSFSKMFTICLAILPCFWAFSIVSVPVSMKQNR